MQTSQQGGGFLSQRLCLQRFNCVAGNDQVEVSMAPHEQVIPAEQTREGQLSRGAIV